MVKNFQQKKHAQTETVDRYLQVRGREGGREGGREEKEGGEEKDTGKDNCFIEHWMDG